MSQENVEVVRRGLITSLGPALDRLTPPRPLGIIAITLGIIGLVIVSDAANDLSNAGDCLDNADTLAQMNKC
jgi:hypothetical protein